MLQPKAMVQWLKPLLVLFAVATLAFYVVNLRQDAQVARAQAGWLKALNDSTTAQVAALTAERDELLALKDAARELRGNLVAGVQVKTPAEMVSKPKEVILSTVTVDSARSAVLLDSTQSGIKLRIEAEAPPFPAPLKIGYDLYIPPFNPQFGFVQTGDRYAAVVSWAGQEFTVENAFFVPPPKPDPRLSLFTGGRATHTLIEQRILPEAYIGARLRVKSYRAGLTGSLGLNLDPRVSVFLERDLWSK